MKLVGATPPRHTGRVTVLYRDRIGANALVIIERCAPLDTRAQLDSSILDDLTIFKKDSVV